MSADLRTALAALLAYVERTTDPDATLDQERDAKRRDQAIAQAREALGIPGNVGGLRPKLPTYTRKG